MSNNKTNTKITKKKGNFIKILVLAVVLAVVAISGFIVSDLFFSEDDSNIPTETVTVTVKGTEIYINGDKKVTLTELDDYFTQRFENKQYCTIALINDTQHPADIETYNSVVEVLGKFGINHEPLTHPATVDEFKLPTFDEA